MNSIISVESHIYTKLYYIGTADNVIMSSIFSTEFF